MATGTVKWFNKTKGYGFITPDAGHGDKDVFVHITAVQEAGLDDLAENSRVSYEATSARGKIAAGGIRVI